MAKSQLPEMILKQIRDCLKHNPTFSFLQVLSKTVKVILAIGGMSLCTMFYLKSDKLKLPSLKVFDFKLPSFGLNFLSA